MVNTTEDVMPGLERQSLRPGSAKEKGTPVVGGGSNATMLPEQCNYDEIDTGFDIQTMFEEAGLPGGAKDTAAPYSQEWYDDAPKRHKARQKEREYLSGRGAQLRKGWTDAVTSEMSAWCHMVDVTASEPVPRDLSALLARTMCERPQDVSEIDLIRWHREETNETSARLKAELAALHAKLKTAEAAAQAAQAAHVYPLGSLLGGNIPDPPSRTPSSSATGSRPNTRGTDAGQEADDAVASLPTSSKGSRPASATNAVADAAKGHRKSRKSTREPRMTLTLPSPLPPVAAPGSQERLSSAPPPVIHGGSLPPLDDRPVPTQEPEQAVAADLAVLERPMPPSPLPKDVKTPALDAKLGAPSPVSGSR